MKKLIISTISALLCAGTLNATAAQPRNAEVLPRRVAHRNFANMRSAVPETPIVFPSKRPQPYPYNFHETDGLSRNPNDCVVWGCIDSN
jgi:hypothetical protein